MADTKITLLDPLVDDAVDDVLPGVDVSTGNNVKIPLDTIRNPANASAATKAEIRNVVIGLQPTGNDQTAEIYAYLNDTTQGQVHADFGAGDFIIDGDLQISSRIVDDIEGRGWGLRFRGMGPAVTRFLDVRSNKSTPLMQITEPVGIDVGNRSYQAHFSDFSLLAATTGGVPLSLTDTPDGVGIVVAALSGTGYGAFVLHSGKMERVRFSGHQYPLSIDDTTQFVFEHTRFTRFLTAVRLGGNVDIVQFRNCGWGSEGSNNDASWMAMTCIDSGWTSGVGPGPGGGNVMLIDGAWVMRLGTFIREGSVGTEAITVTNSYLEAVRRYFYVDHTNSSLVHRIKFDNCQFSLMDVNDFTSNDPANVGYGAKIQGGSTGMSVTAGGPSMMVTLRDCYGSGTVNNAFISSQGGSGFVDWINNQIPAHATYGHMRNSRTANATYRTVKLPSTNASYKGKFGDGGGAYGIRKLHGDPIEHVETIASGATFQIAEAKGDRYVLTLPDGNCTIDAKPYGSEPQNVFTRGATYDIYLKAPATVTADRTISFTSRTIMGANLTMLAADAGKGATFRLKANSDTGSCRLVLDSPYPTFEAIS